MEESEGIYKFSLGGLAIGLVFVVAGTIVIYFHRQIADTFFGGAGMYDRVKLYGLIAVGVGFGIATGLVQTLLYMILGMFFGKH